MQCRWIWAVCLLTALVGCTQLPEKQPSGSAGASATGCSDQDGDGFGDNCTAGRDCNDLDPTVTDQCFSACSDPSKGCDCNGDAPVPCFLPQSANPDGTIMCHEGTRYCRGGFWSACEDVHSYSVAPRQESKLLPDVLPRRTCSDCEQNCFVAEDPLAYVDGGIAMYEQTMGGQIEQIPAGGLTLRRLTDASVTMVDAGPSMFPDGGVTEWPVPDAGPCTVGMNPLDTDCDNIPNYYDPYPANDQAPFVRPPETIVATTATNVAIDVDINDFVFRIDQADLYFTLDVTRNQNVERAAFINAINNIGVSAAPNANLVDKVVAAHTGSTTYDCLDLDGVVGPDNYRKDEGLLGAARCFLGDVNFGLGFMDEVPVRDPCSITFGGTTILGITWGATTWNECHYGDDTLRVPYRNLFDLSDDATAFQASTWRLPQIGTRLEIPQSGVQALWAIANGNSGDLYYGADRPAFGARSDCPAGTYGAACFRSGVLPITFMFTDTGQHNGPTNYVPVGYRPNLTAASNPNWAGAPYAANNLAFPSGNWGTPHAGGWRAQHLPRTNETFFQPVELGVIDNQRLSFTGSTIGMSSDAAAATMGTCGAVAGTPDAFFAFNIANNGTPVTISTTGTPYDSNGTSTQTPNNFARVLSLFPNISATSTTAIGMNYNAGPINGTIQRFTGNTTGLMYNTLGSVSRCGADGHTGAAIIDFTAAAGSVISGDITGAGAVMDIYQTAPLADPLQQLVPATNDTFATAYEINPVGTSPGYQSLVGSTGGMPFNLQGTTVGCGAADVSSDVVFRFHVAGPTTVRLDTEGSGFNTVLSLHDAPPIAPNTLTIDNTMADSITGWNMGAADNAVTTLNGDNTGATAQFLGNSVSGSSCLGADSDSDHLIPFVLTGPTTVQAQELAGGANPPIAIYNAVTPTQGYSTNTDASFAPNNGASAATAYNFTTVGGLANRRIQLTGFTTSGKGEHHTTDMFSACGSYPPAAGADDVVYRFNSPVAISGATFRVEGAGATRPMMALFTQQPLEYSSVTNNGLHASAGVPVITLSSAGPFLYSGDTAAAGINHDYSEWGLAGEYGCNTNVAAPDAIFRISNPAVQNVTFRMTSTSAMDPVLRLFPAINAGTAAAPWTKNSTTLAGTASDTYLNANLNVFTVTGQTTRRDGNFSGGFADHSDNGCASDNGSRDAFYKINLTTRTTVWLHAHGDDEITMAVYPGANTTFTAANYATDYLGTTIPCDQGGNDVYRTVTLDAGQYFVVLKSRYRCGTLGCLLSPNGRQDDPIYLEAFDATAQTPLIATTSPQAQLDCDDDGGGGTVAQINYANLPVGTYDLVATSQTAAGGTYRLQVGGGSMPTAAQCSTTTMATGVSAVSRSAAQCDTAANANANPLGTLTNSWVRVDSDFGSGTWGDHADICGSNNGTRDAFYQFTVSRQSTMSFTAWGDSDTDVGVTIVNTAGPYTLAGRPTDPVTLAPVTCASSTSANTINITLSPGTYYAVVKAHNDNCGGLCFLTPNMYQDDGFHLEIRDLTEQNVQQMTVPTINAGQDYFLVVKGQNATAGNYNLTVGSAVSPVMCLSPNASNTAALPAGTHYALVKGGAAGAYNLTIGETGAALDNRLTCDDDSGPNTQSSITYALPAAGDYYVVLKGRTNADGGAYQLNIRDLGNPVDTWQACGSAGGTSSFTTPPLAGGAYQAVIKGTDGVEGAFTAQLYDASSLPTASSCSTGGAISTTLNAGRHVVGIKGRAGDHTGSGAYQLNIQAGAAIPVATAAQRGFFGKTWATTRAALVARGMKVVPMQSCEPGTDWGTGSGDPNNGGTSGAFNGCGNNYSGPLAFVLFIVYAALGWVPFVGCLVFGIVAIVFVLIGLVTVNATTPTVINNPASCVTPNSDGLYSSVQDPPGTNPPRGAWPQSKEIARATDTVTTEMTVATAAQMGQPAGTSFASGRPLAYWLDRDPNQSTVAYNVADALYQITQQTRMDVELSLVWDTITTPGYQVNVQAVQPAAVADRCDSITGPRHLGCEQGDKPEFSASFTNPALNPVPESTPADFPAGSPDWNGAWPGVLRVLGDGQFVLAEYPIVLIPPLPSMVMPPMPPVRYSGPASYFQDIGTRECVGNNLPDWTDLYFNAEMPPGTRIEFRSCATDVPADLGDPMDCPLQTVTVVTATNVPCFNDSQCRTATIEGYCGSGGPDYPGGYCQVLSPRKHKGLCSSEPECPDGVTNGINGSPLLSDCVMGECEYDSQPADVGAALGADNFKRNSRMQITLHPDPSNAYAPNLLNWAVTYVCTPNQ